MVFSSTVRIGRYVLHEDIITFAVKYRDRPADHTDGSNNGSNSIIEEAQIMAKLDNPHIVQIFGVVESYGSHMLVMELAPLGTLKKYLQQNRSVDITNI